MNTQLRLILCTNVYNRKVEATSETINQQGERPTLEMSNGRRWAVTIGVMTGMAIAALEATVVGTAMPTVIASLGGINHYSWVLSLIHI